MVHYLLEKSRVVHQHPEERTYHIFYQLLAGAGSSMLSSLLLDENQIYHYLGPEAPKQKLKPNDAADFFDLVKALSEIGMGLKAQNDIFKLISTIMHLGNFQFQFEHDEGSSVSGSRLAPSKYVSFVSNMLGVPENKLASALTSRTVRSSGRSSFYSVPLSPVQVNKKLISP